MFNVASRLAIAFSRMVKICALWLAILKSSAELPDTPTLARAVANAVFACAAEIYTYLPEALT